MNIKIANRLVELRKSRGYSQEALADMLGVSRQAVSKWERAEAAPDTDNLIALASLYGISIDDLLDYTPDSKSSVFDDQIEYDASSNSENENAKIHIGPGGVHISDGENGKVDIGWNAIHIESKDASGNLHPFFCEANCSEDCSSCSKAMHNSKNSSDSGIVDGISFMLVTIAYILLATLGGWWHPAWLIFFAQPLIPALVKPSRLEGSFPIFVVGVYLSLGCLWNLWHPAWVVFLLIPVFYTFVDIIKKSAKRKNEAD